MVAKKNIAVLIPCLNEEKTISNVIKKIKAKVHQADVFLFDNDSTDDSKHLAKKAGAIVFNVTKKGKGNVVRKMFSEISADIYIMIDGDDTYDVENINKMIALLQRDSLDMVVAKRVSNDTSAYRFGHKTGNRIFTNLVKYTFGNQIDDLFSGFRIFSRQFVKSFPCNSIGFEIETELTIHALEQRLDVAEVECLYFARPSGSESKLKTFGDGFKILNLILILIKDEKPFLFFSLLSLFFLFSSLLIGLPVVFEFLNTGLVDRLPTAVLSGINMVIAFLSFFSGLILDVVKKSRHEMKRLTYLSSK